MTTRIHLSDAEQRLRNFLVDVASFIDASQELQSRVQVRFAGGWVRDKLLGLESDDIDVAINNMTGTSFCEKIRAYTDHEDHARRYQLTEQDLGNIHTVKKNPEKSKNLETAKLRLLGFDLDFVNLRKEVYQSDTRTPEMDFGTPQEDAERRDATVNAILFNLHTEQLEDYTNGLEDLRKKIMRTPLDPVTTFLDDPLRVLRLIRFVTRFDFKLDDTAAAAMRRADIQKALRLKISRERIGIELEKMLRGKRPWDSLREIHRLDLYHTIFTDPSVSDMVEPDVSRWQQVYEYLESLEANESPGSVYKTLVRSVDARYFAWVHASLLPWFDECVSTSKPGTKPTLPWAARVAQEGFKRPAHVVSLVAASQRHLDEIKDLARILTTDQARLDRGTLGMSIRKWDAHGGHWRIQVLAAMLHEALHSPSSNEFTDITTKWQAILDQLESMDLMDAPSIRPPTDGTTLSRALGVRPGPWMQSALEECMRWKLRHPEITEAEALRDGAIAAVESRRDVLKIPSA